MTAVPPHPAMAGVAVRGTELLIGGVPAGRLAERVGTTPFFAYDRGRIADRVQALRQALPAGMGLNYAVKANPMPALVAHMAGLVDGFDVASAGEMRVALDAAGDPARVSFAGPGKTDAELRQAVAAGVLIEVESVGEVCRIDAVSMALGIPARVALRVNPDFALKGSGMRMGGGPQPFGVDAEQAPDLLAMIGRLGLGFEGFHIFAGSQNLRAEQICAAQSATVDLVRRMADHAPAAVRHVNLGGGFGIPYFPEDRSLDLGLVGRHLGGLIARLLDALPQARPLVELGRYLVGEAGLYVTRVVDRKVSRGHTFLVVDGGLHHQLAASGNFGQVIRRNYPLALAARMGEAAVETVSVVGCLCTPLDLLGDRVDLPRADVGDLIVLFQSGAYGLTASPVDFLGHPRPPEVLV